MCCISTESTTSEQKLSSAGKHGGIQPTVVPTDVTPSCRTSVSCPLPPPKSNSRPPHPPPPFAAETLLLRPAVFPPYPPGTQLSPRPPLPALLTPALHQGANMNDPALWPGWRTIWC
eukprot:GHVQ01009599.1.p2 GENE.GHVQ01009599.1~~GHVQ01009599.1.p2  ORF type:complete len:117 (-),score=14.98 GHVQ01009599.1:141-491(-)